MFIMRLPSIFFMLALALYYLPKLFRCYRPIFRKAHILAGSLSALTMLMAMLMQIGTPKFGRYFALTFVLGLIVLTGFLLPKQGKKMRHLHILCTIGFFVVLFGSIFLSRLFA